MLFADSHLLTRSLPWHSTHLSPPSTAGEQSSSLFLLASDLLQPAHCLLLFCSYQDQHAPGCALQTLTCPLWCSSLRKKQNKSPDSVYSTSYQLFQATMIVFSSQLLIPVFWFYYVASQLPAFEIGLGEMKCSHWGEGTNRQWLQMEFGQWSEIPIQKIDRTLFTNWSLKFQRGESHKCYIRSQRSFDF